MNKKLKPGQTWYPRVRFYDEDEDGNLTARNCTGETAILFIKRTSEETAASIEELTINWIDQSGGVGYFAFEYEMTKDFTDKYWYQWILYKTADMSVVEPSKIYKIIMEPTLEKDLP